MTTTVGGIRTTAIKTHVRAHDQISQAGVVSQLRGRPEIRIASSPDEAEVAVVVVHLVDEEAVRLVRALRCRDHVRVLLVASVVDDPALVTAAEAGVSGLVRRCDASADLLARTIARIADGEGEVPADLLGRLLEQVGRLQRQVLTPRGLTFSGLTARESQVLRLVADGYDTAEIALKLSYSERTVKNVLHDVTTRLHLRNRSHAVAYALREGLI